MKIPWKLKKLIHTIVGEDKIHNKAKYSPDFSVSAFAQLQLPIASDALNVSSIVNFFLQRQKSDFFCPQDKVLTLADTLQNQYPQWRKDILDAAEQICTKGYGIYHLKTAPLSRSFDWLGLSKGPGKDQLYLSRPQRFGFAPVLAQAALFDPSYISKLDEILNSWQEYAKQSPYRWPYNSSHALTYRLIALSWCWFFIGALHKHKPTAQSESILFSILTILRNDAEYLSPRLGLAHPNNHLLADYFTGWLLLHEFPELLPDRHGFSQYETKWHAELLRQFYPDGGNFEHAMHYHEHGCEMAVIYRLLAKPGSIKAEVNSRIKNMLAFQIRLAGTANKPWELGDTTEDTLLPLDNTTGWSIAALRNVHYAIYQETVLQYGQPMLDYKSFWLLAGDTPKEHSPLPNPAQMVAFNNTGMFHWQNKQESQELLFRTGIPPESAYMPGHMHADILSLFWRVGGIDVLAASGTYSYKYSQLKGQGYRSFFCGPFAHSCTVIDDQDPLGQLTGDFRDQDNGLRVKTVLFGDTDKFALCIGEVQSQNSYHGLRRGVLHICDRYILVFDLLTSEQSNQSVSCGWYFGAAVKPRIDQGNIEIATIAGQPIAKILQSQNNPIDTFYAQNDPPRGWQSNDYGRKTPTHYLSCKLAKNTRCHTYLLTQTMEYLAVNNELDENGILQITVDSLYGQDKIFVSSDGTAKLLDTPEASIVASAAGVLQSADKVATFFAIECCDSSISIGEDAQSISASGNLFLTRTAQDTRWKSEI